ncbi:MAG: toxin-antitoxin system YwqK family antitoxin [Bacteroidia bacterium]
MKVVFGLFLFFYCTFLFSQEVEDGMGRTYYDASKKQVKEIYHFILEYKFLRDPQNGEILKDTTIAVKNGPYLMYHPNGKLAESGHYKQNKKSGNWKYYNKSGELIKTEDY